MLRKAVGAIVKDGSEFMLVHKVKIMSGKGAPLDILPEWDFPRGGVNETETDLRSALLRELEEETGSAEFRIIRQLEQKMCFDFTPEIRERLGYAGQETTMFLVQYAGDRSDLHPHDDEIGSVRFFSYAEVIERLHHESAKEFFKRYAE